MNYFSPELPNLKKITPEKQRDPKVLTVLSTYAAAQKLYSGFSERQIFAYQLAPFPPPKESSCNNVKSRLHYNPLQKQHVRGFNRSSVLFPPPSPSDQETAILFEMVFMVFLFSGIIKLSFFLHIFTSSHFSIQTPRSPHIPCMTSGAYKFTILVETLLVIITL